MIAHCDKCRVHYRVDGSQARPRCPRCDRKLRPEGAYKGRSVQTVSGGLPSLGKRR